MSVTTDTARLPLLLTTLRLPIVARLWSTIGATADTEGWPAARTLATLLEHKVAERASRRTARHLAEARLPAVRTHDTFSLTAAIEKLDKYRLLILNNLSCVQESQAETSVLFELISARCERRSTLITASYR